MSDDIYSFISEVIYLKVDLNELLNAHYLIPFSVGSEMRFLYAFQVRLEAPRRRPVGLHQGRRILDRDGGRGVQKRKQNNRWK